MILEYRKGFKIYTFSNRKSYKEFIMKYIMEGMADRIAFKGDLMTLNYKGKKNIILRDYIENYNPKMVHDLWDRLLREIDYTDLVVVVKKTTERQKGVNI